ncbi:16S rRNA (guanine(527)-N(7))-methyltransferase RsmG [Bdellovibrio bacteriovorus]|uniref:Ribosomal RNA small subunit methyltransferase G n=1 Tax=Bdellovibrio bacteriovorus TaxID=959 RepID=A0A150WC86_BDEBC|nr:RsmG family class I SAM-dependent methyltransferase [Bdellovibrio bacteriovorus]KYG60586.1 ribosomal RNA small subunit methyltransferase G 1 [Bdellovibrio bacteriovorus]
MYFESRIPIILQLGFREEALPQLKAYIDLLWSSNEELNLISRKMTFEELIDNHIIDCLLPLKYFPTNLKAAADFGSGGGLPAVIYAIQFPQMRYHLYEKSPKKQEFLTKCKSIASNLEIHGEIPKDLEAIEVVTARGFKPIDVILDVSRTYFNKQGKYFLLKARREKIDEEMALALKKFKNAKATITPLVSPVLEVERHLVQL